MKGYRVAVVSPLSPFGQRVRALLDQSDEKPLPVIELKLFDGQPKTGATLTQFEDEVLVTQALDPDLFPSLDVIFVGEDTSPEVLAEATGAADRGVLTLVAGGQLEAPVVAVGLNDPILPEGARLFGMPSGASILLGKVLEALGAAFDVEQAQATVILPAAELGNTAVEELHQQVVQLLSFGAPPTKVIGEQLAFNLLAPSDKGEGEKELHPELTVAKEVCVLAGLEENRVSVSLLLAPVFHSYAASLWVELAEPATVADVVAALDKRMDLDTSRRYEAPDGPPRVVSPAAVAGSKKVHVGAVRADGRSEKGFWLWLAADSIAVDAAQNALELAKRLLADGGRE
ncbi:MAG TPA: Asd/ArgC dimerization domain-containing protein [Vicinamibacteria bacterium]|jgi:aspartate-semialdehyde dehydrogenase